MYHILLHPTQPSVYMSIVILDTKVYKNRWAILTWACTKNTEVNSLISALDFMIMYIFVPQTA